MLGVSRRSFDTNTLSCWSNPKKAMGLLTWRPQQLLQLLTPLLFLFLAVGPRPGRAAPLGEYFSLANADAYAEAALRTLGDVESLVSDKDYAVRLLSTLDKASVAAGYKSSACATASAGLSSGDIWRIHHGIFLRKGVGCTGEIPAGARGAVEDAMQVHGYCRDGMLCCTLLLSAVIDFVCLGIGFGVL